MTLDFLSVLPNQQDPIPARYEKIRNGIIDAMNNEALTPTHKKSHAPARRLLQAKALLKNLLSEKDLEYLAEYDEEPPLWTGGATQRNTNADRFLDSLNIQGWGLDEFVDLLVDRTSEGRRYVSCAPYWVEYPDSDFMQWLASKSNEWHQQLYALLFSELAADGGLDRFKDCQLARLFPVKYSVGTKCFFPDDGDQDDSVLPRVAADVYISGRSKTQQHNARKFLEEIGVRVVGEADKVELILKQRYTYDAKIPDNKTYRRDLKRFVVLVEKEPSQSQLFKDHYIFKCADDKWREPNSVYLDEPYIKTGLSAYYDSDGDGGESYPLNDVYREAGVSLKRVASFAKAVGAKVELHIDTCCYDQNPEWDYLRQVGGERHTSPIDKDYEIDGLEKMLTKPTLRLSQLVWRTMVGLPNDGRHLVATYRRNASAGSRKAASSLVHVLRAAFWVPQGEGSFVRPAEASPELLPDGFSFDPGQRWLEAVEWGEEDIKRSEQQQRQKETFARELGFSDLSSLERARRFAALPPEDQERFLADLERSAEIGLSDYSSANPERRASRVGELAAQAPDRRTEKRMRSVSVGREEVKAKTAQYLLQQYVVGDEIICQVCRRPMPFKLDDGSAYFEKVEFLSELKKRHHQNYLALCPNHTAMFRHANSTKDLMMEIFTELTRNELEVVLAQENKTVYFTEIHIADLRKVIEVDRGMTADFDGDHTES